MAEDQRLTRLLARRDKAAESRKNVLASRKALVDNAADEAREDLLPEEDTEFRKLSSDIKEWDAEIVQFDERIQELAAEAERDIQITQGAAAVRRARSQVESVSESATYVRGNGRSYIRDLARMSAGMDGTGDAAARLQRHAVDVATAPEYRTSLDRTDTNGGYFVPPAWLVSQYVELARAGRVTADLCTQQVLPGGTDTINVPKIATGVTVTEQATDSASVSETLAVDTVVTASVNTIAGQQSVQQQLLDQSPINFDEVIFRDLAAAYNAYLDQQVIFGTGANGQHRGLTHAGGTPIAVTWTNSAPTVTGLYGVLNNAISQIHTARFASPTAIIMHPRRWQWILNAVDGNSRPLVNPSTASYNGIAAAGAPTAQGAVGNLLGINVYVDPNVPTTVSSTQDEVFIVKADDLLLYEGAVQVRALPEVLSGTLGVRLQLFGYSAFVPDRQPKGLAILSGTGFAAPTW